MQILVEEYWKIMHCSIVKPVCDIDVWSLKQQSYFYLEKDMEKLGWKF